MRITVGHHFELDAAGARVCALEPGYGWHPAYGGALSRQRGLVLKACVANLARPQLDSGDWAEDRIEVDDAVAAQPALRQIDLALGAMQPTRLVGQLGPAGNGHAFAQRAGALDEPWLGVARFGALHDPVATLFTPAVVEAAIDASHLSGVRAAGFDCDPGLALLAEGSCVDDAIAAYAALDGVGDDLACVWVAGRLAERARGVAASPLKRLRDEGVALLASDAVDVAVATSHLWVELQHACGRQSARPRREQSPRSCDPIHSFTIAAANSAGHARNGARSWTGPKNRLDRLALQWHYRGMGSCWNGFGARRSVRAWVVGVVCIVACGDDGVNTDGGSSGAPTTGATGTSAPSTGDSGTVGGSTAADDTDGTTGSATTAGDTTNTTGSEGGSTGDTGTTSETGETEGDSSGDTTGGGVCAPVAPQGDTCLVDDDCQISGDCCSCVAYNPMFGAPGNCGGGCGQSVCEQIGADSAVCSSGVCQVLGGSCDQTTVTCDRAVPACPAGELPQVVDECYTGQCLPVEHCDWVPDCSFCPGGEVCVITRTDECDQHACIPAIPKCGGAPSCGCEGAIACSSPFDMCAIEDGAVVCS